MALPPLPQPALDNNRGRWAQFRGLPQNAQAVQHNPVYGSPIPVQGQQMRPPQMGMPQMGQQMPQQQFRPMGQPQMRQPQMMPPQSQMGQMVPPMGQQMGVGRPLPENQLPRSGSFFRRGVY